MRRKCNNLQIILTKVLQHFTPDNVVRGNQNYANGILTGASGHELQTVDRMLFTNF